MDGVEPQRIDMELSNPLQRVFDEIAANVITLRAIEIDRLAPRSPIQIGKIRGKILQIIPLRTQMVVNDVEHYRSSFLVASVYESLQGRGASVRVLHYERVDAVITPVAVTGKLPYPHNFDCGYPQIPKLINSRNDCFEYTLCRRC